MLDTIKLKHGPVMADRTLGYVRRIFNWHAARSDDFRSPVVRGMTRIKASETARQRILTDDEIRKVWLDAEGPFLALIKFLLLTGARREEAAQMTWDEVKDGIWELPGERNKTKLPLARPLSSKALEVMKRSAEMAARMYSPTTARQHGRFSRSKKKFDAATGVSNYVLHDLRRTARSLMSRAGVNDHHAERCLGHVIGGVKGVYDRHHYRPEMQRAYDALAALIERIASPPRGNVTSLRKKTRA